MLDLRSEDIVKMIVERIRYNKNRYLEYSRAWDMEACKEDFEDTKLDEYEELLNNYHNRYLVLQDLYQQITGEEFKES